jgi:hypothetical protein
VDKDIMSPLQTSFVIQIEILKDTNEELTLCMTPSDPKVLYVPDVVTITLHSNAKKEYVECVKVSVWLDPTHRWQVFDSDIKSQSLGNRSTDLVNKQLCTIHCYELTRLVFW